MKFLKIKTWHYFQYVNIYYALTSVLHYQYLTDVSSSWQLWHIEELKAFQICFCRWSLGYDSDECDICQSVLAAFMTDSATHAYELQLCSEWTDRDVLSAVKYVPQISLCEVINHCSSRASLSRRWTSSRQDLCHYLTSLTSRHVCHYLTSISFIHWHCKRDRERSIWYIAMIIDMRLHQQYRPQGSLERNDCHELSLHDQHISYWSTNIQCESKNPPPVVFWIFFLKWLGIVNQFLHTYYTILSTLDYKFLFKYLQVWQSYAILSTTT